MPYQDYKTWENNMYGSPISNSGANFGAGLIKELASRQGGYKRYIDSQNQQQEANTGYDAIMAQGQKAYDPTNIAQYYNMAQGNLNRAGANVGAYVGRQAGAHSTNMLNPSSFILGNIQQSQAPYAAQSQQLQATGAAAQQSGAEGLTNLMMLLQRAKQGDAQAASQLQFQYAQLQQQQNQFEESQSGWGEKLLGAGLGFLGSGTGTRLLFPGSKGMGGGSSVSGDYYSGLA